jgi:hypothetical protein
MQEKTWTFSRQIGLPIEDVSNEPTAARLSDRTEGFDSGPKVVLSAPSMRWRTAEERTAVGVERLIDALGGMRDGFGHEPWI